MKLFIEIFLIGISSFVLSLILIPYLRRIAIRVDWVDRPNRRKLHRNPIPIVGGIAIVLSSALSILLSYTLMTSCSEHLIMLSAGLVLFVMGVLDDRMDIKASYKLLIQIACAYFVAQSGSRVTSFYGIFGIYEIPMYMQYIVTIVVLTGLINAFNLMDGADGVAGGLTIIGFTSLSIISFLLGRYELTIFYVSIVGATIGFLKFNLSRSKIFMGDGGSLSIGFILAVSGLKMLETVETKPTFGTSLVLLVVISIFLLPVLDSLRVYGGRIRRGISPFTADKSHIHHLLILLGLKHSRAALIISISSVSILVMNVILNYFFSITTVLIIVSLTFLSFTNILNINRNVVKWRKKVHKMEKSYN